MRACMVDSAGQTDNYKEDTPLCRISLTYVEAACHDAKTKLSQLKQE